MYAEQAIQARAAAGIGGDVLADLEAALDEPHPAELSREELDRMRRRKIAEENQAAHAKLVGLMQTPRARPLR